ncbi:MAG: spermidine synthase [Phycisphaerae bacterium]
MRRPAANPHENLRLPFATLVAVALISAALIAYEIVLMRRLLIESWHHFGYLVISAALLGFGASGTFLALIERRVRARPGRTMLRCAFALAAALLVMPRLATLLPVTARFIPDDLWNQVGWWSLYWVTALLPFLIGATLLGAALMTAGPHVGRVYAANLFGSGLGAAGAVLVVSRLALEYTLWPSFVLAVAATVLLRPVRFPRARFHRFLAVAKVTLLAGFALAADAAWPLRPVYDKHKEAARLQQLVAQGSARRVAARPDPHGYVELYESELFHDLPFLALSAPPPPMYSLIVNGDPAGSVLRIDHVAEATVMDRTLMALPYRLVGPRPAVLLIGEAGGANVWLARRQDAARIDIVQPNAAIVSVVRAWSGSALPYAEGDVRTEDPRTFLASRDRPQYDLIQISSLEGLGVGSAGMRGLAEDHLATVEGFADCLRALSDDGAVAISRGIQQPGRENIRIFATLAEALESVGVADASRHIIQIRDYLGVCTLATRSPLSDARRQTLRTAIREFNLTPVWYDGLPIQEVNQPDAMQGPPGTPVDWLHHAACEILSPRRAQFYESWLLNVRPPHDDSPFFWDFYKPEGVTALKQFYGDLWLTRAELGRLFLYTSLLIAAGAAIVLILVPLSVVELRRWKLQPGAHGRGQRAPRSRSGFESTPRPRRFSYEASDPRGTVLWTIVYFGGIGLGFMGIEMALISRAIRWLGDPVIASAVVIGGVLVGSGIGSLTGRRIVRDKTWLAPAIVAVAAGVVRLVGWHAPGAGLTGLLPLLFATLPATYFMGIPMPAGLTVLNGHSPRLVPWAWGVNGVASVIATSAAIAVAMTAGYRTVVILAAAAYALAALAAAPLARHRQSPTGSRASEVKPASGHQT